MRFAGGGEPSLWQHEPTTLANKIQVIPWWTVPGTSSNVRGMTSSRSKSTGDAYNTLRNSLARMRFLPPLISASLPTIV